MTANEIVALTAGEYSDFRVLALFASDELAEAGAEVQRATNGDGYGDTPEKTTFRYFDRSPVVGLRLSTFYNESGAEYAPGAQSIVGREYLVPEWELEKALPVDVAVERLTTSALCYRLTVEGTDHERVRRTYSDTRARILAEPWFLQSATNEARDV